MVGAPEQNDVMKVGDMEINIENRSVKIGDKEISLTAKEFDLLKLFVTNPGKVYSREQLLSIIWNYDYLGHPDSGCPHQAAAGKDREKTQPA
jgi:DNA-binding response OmpR family regulator